MHPVVPLPIAPAPTDAGFEPEEPMPLAATAAHQRDRDAVHDLVSGGDPELLTHTLADQRTQQADHAQQITRPTIESALRQQPREIAVPMPAGIPQEGAFRAPLLPLSQDQQ